MLHVEPSQANRSVRWAVALTLFVLIAPHWLLTRDFADGTVIRFARDIGSVQGLFLWLSDSNWLLAIGLFKIIFALSDISGLDYLIFVKCVLSLLLIALYLECSAWARSVFHLPLNQASLAALLCVASPGLYTLANSTAIVNLLCIYLVFLGHRLYWSDTTRLRFVGLVLLVMSFQVNSNLVFALALEVVRWWRFEAQRKQRMGWFFVLLLATVSVYFSIRILSPPRQLFVEYNQLINPFSAEGLPRIIRVIAMFLTWGAIPLIALSAIAAASFFSRNRPRNPSTENVAVQHWVGSLLALGFLAAAAAFPYVMVGKGPPLFTPTAYGDGLTEQVFRAAYAGPIAPTWANTSTRHGYLFSIPVALLTWIAATALVQKLKMKWSALRLYALLMPLALVWVLPAYGNKLHNQWTEMSLVKGFRALPAARHGIVELRYRPVSSWLVWTGSANIILRDAWGTSGYLGFFHSLDVYRDDLYWQYHTYFLSKGVLQSRLLQNATVMDEFPGADCHTQYLGDLQTPSAVQMVFAGWFSDLVVAASIQQVAASCVAGRVLPNPKPDKKVIY